MMTIICYIKCETCNRERIYECSPLDAKTEFRLDGGLMKRDKIEGELFFCNTDCFDATLSDISGQLTQKEKHGWKRPIRKGYKTPNSKPH